MKLDRTSSLLVAESERRTREASSPRPADAVNGLTSSPQTVETKNELLKSFFMGLGVAKHK
jgi:hypothetical protein